MEAEKPHVYLGEKATGERGYKVAVALSDKLETVQFKKGQHHSMQSKVISHAEDRSTQHTCILYIISTQHTCILYIVYLHNTHVSYI